MRIALVHGRDLGADAFSGDRDPEGAIDAALHAALAARGIEPERPRWNDPGIDWSDYDLAVVRTPWDYTEDREAFVAWAQQVATRVRLENPADVLRWNTHKSYLIELEERGVPIVPTAWLGQGARVDLAALCAARGWGEVVVKPTVAAGSDGLLRVTAGDADQPDVRAHVDALLAKGDAMVQPFRSRIREGELSLVAIEGRVTHAVRKLPADGDYRVQGRFGGHYAPEVMSGEVVALAEWIVASVGTPLLFARVDLVLADDGTLELGELEATEPDLYLEHSEQGTEALVDAILRRASDPAATDPATTGPATTDGRQTS
jgi:glutathione synthase/RimK-type ligase-like ATP-grasp enzyme